MHEEAPEGVLRVFFKKGDAWGDLFFLELHRDYGAPITDYGAPITFKITYTGSWKESYATLRAVRIQKNKTRLASIVFGTISMVRIK